MKLTGIGSKQICLILVRGECFAAEIGNKNACRRKTKEVNQKYFRGFLARLKCR